MARSKRARVGTIGSPKTSGRSSNTTNTRSKRYTPPVPNKAKKSGKGMAVLLFTTLGAGFLVIFVDYLGLLPGGASNWYLLLGIFLLGIGFLTATRYR